MWSFIGSRFSAQLRVDAHAGSEGRAIITRAIANER
jgi:hypothetical protein